MKNLLVVIMVLCASWAFAQTPTLVKVGWAYDNQGNAYKAMTFSMPTGQMQIMASNANMRIANSFCADPNKADCKGYGHLYNWSSAQQVCGNIGPGKWRIPTIEEWQAIVGSFPADGDKSFVSYMNVEYQGNSQIRAQGVSGYYFSTSMDNVNGIPFVKLYKVKNGDPSFQTELGDPNQFYSVRCISTEQ
jgi:hypothetical protein